jgi:hypothetical protein
MVQWAQDWQPIATAPKNGDHILAFSVPFGVRFGNLTDPPAVVHWLDDPEKPGFYTSVDRLAPERLFNATHWMPLPHPPMVGDV